MDAKQSVIPLPAVYDPGTDMIVIGDVVYRASGFRYLATLPLGLTQIEVVRLHGFMEFRPAGPEAGREHGWGTAFDEAYHQHGD